MLFFGFVPDQHLTDVEKTTYYRAVIGNGVCSIYSPVAAVVFNETSFDGTNWSNGNPDETKKIVIYGKYSPSGNIKGCSMEISNNAEVIINKNSTITLNKEL